MVGFGWSLPPGCGNVPGDEPLPPCCEECPEEMYTNCPGEDNCEVFQRLVKDESDVDQQMYDDYVETEKVARDAGYIPAIGAQEPPYRDECAEKIEEVAFVRAFNPNERRTLQEIRMRPLTR